MKDVLYHQDAEYLSRVIAQYPLVIIDKLLMEYYRHENNRSDNKEQMIIQW